MHHISVAYNGLSYGIVFGRYINGWFCSVPSWNVGCDMGGSENVGYNTEKLSCIFEEDVARVLTVAIMEYYRGIFI